MRQSGIVKYISCTLLLFCSLSHIGSVTITSHFHSHSFIHCPQSWREVEGLSFPPTPRIQPDGKSWMGRAGDETHEKLVSLYGWTSMIYLILFLLVMFGSASWTFFMSFFRGTYSPKGQDQKVDFSSLDEKAAFVPQIKLINRPFPYLACDIDRLDQDLVGWNDPARSYDHYNLLFDVPFPGMSRKKRIRGNTRNTAQIENQSEFSVNPSYHPGEARDEDDPAEPKKDPNKFPIFSIIKHYPPPWQKKLFDEQKKQAKKKQ